MKTYVFGDSYSVEFNDINLFPPGNLYCDWKGYVPKKYFHLLSESLGSTEIKNYAISGNDNENIFEKFTEVYNEIEPDDLIIFGWTMFNRFSICNNKTPGDQSNNLWGSSVSFNNLEWVLKASQNKSTLLYYYRQMKLINFINSVLKTNKVLHWSWDYNPNYNIDKTIIYETDGVINDYHYNEKTHKELFERMLIEFNNSNHVSIDLWSPNSFLNRNLALEN